MLCKANVAHASADGRQALLFGFGGSGWSAGRWKMDAVSFLNGLRG